MALKSGAVWYRQSADQDDVVSSYQRMHDMDQYHGQASGIFACDECLAGLNPSRGTEMCTVVEAMFSYSTVFSIIGDPVFADKVEQITFNALPATLTPDMWAHQYLQQSNEINSMHQNDYWWNSDGGDSNIYGLEPNYGCCTSNFPQGFPKYLTAMWMMTQTPTSTGLLAALLGPSAVDVIVEDPTYSSNHISVQAITDYPLTINPTIEFVIQAEHSFPLSIRIPGWAAGATVKGSDGVVTAVENGSIYIYSYTNSPNPTSITVLLPTSFRSVRRYNSAVSIYYGPILMALDFSFNTTVLHRYAYQSVDLQYLPTSDWNYAVLIDDANVTKSLSIKSQPIGPFPFDPLNPPLIAGIYGRLIDWPMNHDSADVPPLSPVNSSSKLVPLSLIPYGATLLRIAEIPTLVS